MIGIGRGTAVLQKGVNAAAILAVLLLGVSSLGNGLSTAGAYPDGVSKPRERDRSHRCHAHGNGRRRVGPLYLPVGSQPRSDDHGRDLGRRLSQRERDHDIHVAR